MGYSFEMDFETGSEPRVVDRLGEDPDAKEVLLWPSAFAREVLREQRRDRTYH
jgi:hypothetical protein